jgi:hypothetical protein
MIFIYPYVRQFLSRIHDWPLPFISRKEKEGKEQCTFFPHMISVRMYRPWFICGQSLSHLNDEEKKRKNANHIVFYTVNICTGTFALIDLAFFCTLLPSPFLLRKEKNNNNNNE